jgi:flagellar basal-body rod protein FlgB
MKTPQLSLLANAMQAYTWRAQALTSNLANIDTPGYQRLSVSFEESLQQARQVGGDAQDLSGVTPQVEAGDAPPVLEDELMELADTQMRTQLVTRALREHFEMQRIGITGHAG